MMLRLGSTSPDTREMDLDDIFLARLKLLLIMAKAYLKGWPMGEHRSQAMLENARHVESESIDLGRLMNAINHDGATPEPNEYDYLFYQRVKLLAIMVKAVAKGYPMGEQRKAAMQENLDMICQTLILSRGEADMAFLKVA
ncbi:MAG: hypothetical protein KFF50_03275 [Desulfatitalea sp.]|nr:hypothetical protein [Desulfatitalea sp.]